MTQSASVARILDGRAARALFESNAREAADLVGELTLLLDRVKNDSADLSTASMLTRRIADRLGQLMTLDRLEHSGAVRSDMWSPLDIVEELEHEAVALAGNRIHITVHAPDLVPQSWFFDRELVGMALVNVLHSALTHATRSVVLELHLRAGQLGFGVCDDGGAYPDELLAARPEGLARGEINGNALGIHFARIVACAHNNGGRRGSVDLHNRTDGPGTRFTLWLP